MNIRRSYLVQHLPFNLLNTISSGLSYLLLTPHTVSLLTVLMAVLGTLYSKDGKLEHFGATLMLLFYAHQMMSIQHFTQNCLIFLESQNLVIFHWALIAEHLMQACVQETLPPSLVQLACLHPHQHLKVINAMCDYTVIM